MCSRDGTEPTVGLLAARHARSIRSKSKLRTFIPTSDSLRTRRSSAALGMELRLIFSPLGCQIPGDKTSYQAALISNTAGA